MENSSRNSSPFEILSQARKKELSPIKRAEDDLNLLIKSFDFQN